MDAFHLPRLFLAALLLLSPLESPAQARTPSLDEARAAFERYAPNTRFHDYDTSFGDFNGDGITDFVTFVGDSRYNDNGVQDLKVAAFLGARDGTFTFHEASSNILGHERVTHVLKVRQQSIFLHRDGSGGCCSHWVEEFQFKMRHGRLVLIGAGRHYRTRLRHQRKFDHRAGEDMERRRQEEKREDHGNSQARSHSLQGLRLREVR